MKRSTTSSLRAKVRRLRLLPWVVLALAPSGVAHAAPEELILPVALYDQAPVPVIVYRIGDRYYVPMSQARDLGLTLAKGEDVPGIDEPVIAALTVRGISDDLLKAEVPLTYFSRQSFRYLQLNDALTLEALPAAWVNYDIYHQNTPGLNPLGGTFSVATSYGGYSLKGLWQLNRSTVGPRFLRASTTLEKSLLGHDWTLGDVVVAQDLPLLANRQVLGLQVKSSGKLDRGERPLMFSGMLPSNGILSVLANQQMLYRAPARLGTYEVQGLPSLPGENRYSVFFDDGESVRLLDSFLVDAPMALLPVGAFEYQVSAGLPRLLDSESLTLEYGRELVLDASATYGLHRNHNISAQMLVSKEESWLGGTLTSEWTPRLTSTTSLFSVSGPGNSGAVGVLGVQYSTSAFRAGFSVSKYTNRAGTPLDGFLSESKVFAGLYGFNLYALQSAYISAGSPSSYKTLGLSKSYSWGRTALNLSASKTIRDGQPTDPFFAAILSWNLDQSTRASATLSEGRITAGASYQSDQRWGASYEQTNAAGGSSNSVSGFYSSQIGTIFASTSAGVNTMGISGGLALFKGPDSIEYSLTARQRGDSLLVVDTGAAGAEVLLEAQHRYVANKNGLVTIPLSSQSPQRVELDLMTLDPELTSTDTQHLVQTKPNQAFLLKFATSLVGFGVNLKLASGAPVPEGSVVFLPNETTLVAGDGGVWMPVPVPVFKVQTGPNTYCTVSGVRREGTYQCE